MPFTVSHVAAVLPLRRSARLRAALPFAALAAGAMTPDLPVLVPWSSHLGAGYARTHSLLGVLTLDVLLGVGFWAAWRLVAPVLRRLSPRPIRERWMLPSTRTGLARVPLAVALGAGTHVTWDSFTHTGRFGTRHIAVLADPQPWLPLGLPGHSYAQYLSSVVGLVVLAVAATRLPRVPGRSPVAAAHPDPRPLDRGHVAGRRGQLERHAGHHDVAEQA